MKHLEMVQCAAILSLMVGVTGCNTVNRVGVRMDQAVTKVTEPGSLVYEGTLEEIQQFGPMMAIQLSGGKLYNVVNTPSGLKKGDVVRVYSTEKGYEARLWKVQLPPTRS